MLGGRKAFIIFTINYLFSHKLQIQVSTISSGYNFYFKFVVCWSIDIIFKLLISKNDGYQRVIKNTLLRITIANNYYRLDIYELSD